MSKARVIRKHNRAFTRDQLPKGRESVESHAEFLQLNWRLLAAMAWNGYMTGGRGAVVIDAMHALDAPVGAPWETGYTEGTYIPLADLERLGIAATREKRLITQYEPEREIVAIFLRGDGGVSGYRMSTRTDLSPPQALGHYGGRLPTQARSIKPGPQG
jgi:hypothetical protein